jgi:glucose/arabinose dehydrogenase
VLAVTAALAACAPDDPMRVGPPPPGSIGLQVVVTGLEWPVFLTAPPGDTLRLFVLEKEGRIRIIRNDTLLARPFLDITGQVALGSEQGLLGLAFDPGYATNKRFYISYTDPAGDARLARYHVTADPDSAHPVPDDNVLTIDHPNSQANHNGGMVAFGPDGMLYWSHGDGGGGGDPFDSGQDRDDMLAVILRIQVSDALGYAIPAGNPFTAPDEPAIWCYGLRNAWRFCFDRETGDLYIGDVGQDLWEELDVATAASGGGRGLNFGWSVREGNHCFEAATCASTGLTPAVLEYGHGEGCSVTGGYVYRGSAIPSLRGHYFYADYCQGWVRSFRHQAGAALDQREWPSLAPGGDVTSFGEDGRGELYVLSAQGGVYRFIEP